MRPSAALVLTALLASAPASAQVLTSPPAGIILPNYDLVRVGQWEAIESGAVVARTEGPLANVYNPAGLAASKKTEINGSATGYQYTTLSLEGIGDKATSSRLADLSGFLGVALAEPLIRSTKWRLGFSVYAPLSWKPGTLSGSGQITSAGTDLLLNYRTQVSLHAVTPALAAGVNLSPRIRLGFGFQVPIVSVLQEQTTSLLATSASTAVQTDRSFAADGSTWLIRGTAGVQWDVASALSLGLMLESPTARVWGSSFYSDEITVSSAAGFATSHFRDTDARLEYKLPFLLAGGAALRLGKLTIEGDVRSYSSLSQFDLYTSDSTGIAVSDSGAAPPSQATVTLAPVTLTYRSVLNLALGVRYPLSDRWQLHAGVNSDQSPLSGTKEIFRNVDVFGATAGVSFTGAHLSGSLGLGFQNGQSPGTPVGIGSQVTETRLTVTTFQLLYAVAYAF
ncbi:MAG: OmpP1/FadL family transporter [Gemmatimonadales bacterium]